MMVVTGFLRNVSTSSGVLLLLLLATTTTPLVQPAGASTATGVSSTDGGTGNTGAKHPMSDAADGTAQRVLLSTDDVLEACSTEIASCNADATCSSCVTASSSSERLECHTFNTLTSTAEGCDTNMESACCLDELSLFDCLGNDEFLAYFGCFLESFGCSDEITCDDDDDSSADAATASDGAIATAPASLGGASTAVIAFSCTMFVVLLPLLWV